MGNFEELMLGEDFELELVKKYRLEQYTIPAATLSGRTIYFNVFASPIIPDYIKWYVTNDYIIGMPAFHSEEDAYVVVTQKDGRWKCTTFPVGLRKYKKIKQGSYQVYKYKKGFAIKRHEMLCEGSKRVR